MVPAQQSALSVAQNAKTGMKGGVSVVRQMAMMKASQGGQDGKVGNFKDAMVPVVPVVASTEASGGQENNQKQALKELMIKFEHNQKQMTEAQRQLMEGKSSVFSGVSRPKMLCMLCANNMIMVTTAFVISIMLYGLEPAFDGTLRVGGLIQADGMHVVAAPDAEEPSQKVSLSSLTAEASLLLRPGSAASDASLFLAHETGGKDPAFSVAAPGPMGGGLAISAGDLEAVSFHPDAVLLGLGTNAGNLVTVRNELVLSGSTATTMSQNLEIAPAPTQDLVLRPEDGGIVALKGRDLKVDEIFRVGPRPTYVTRGGLTAYAGEVPTLGVDVFERQVTVGSIVDNVAMTLYGDSTFYGNLTIENGDLNLIGTPEDPLTLTLRDMNFGQVNSLSFRKDSFLGTAGEDVVNFYGSMEMRDDDREQSVMISSRDGTIDARGSLKACEACAANNGIVQLRGHATLGGNFEGTDEGTLTIVGQDTTMHSLAALGDVLIGELNHSTSVEIFGGILAQSHTPGLFSLGVDPLMRMDPVGKTLDFGGQVEAKGNTTLEGRVKLLRGLGNHLTVSGSLHLDESVHIANHSIGVQGLTTLSGHLTGTALWVGGELSLGLNETEQLIVETVVRFDFVPPNGTNGSIPAALIGMDSKAKDKAVLQNYTFEYDVKEYTTTLLPVINLLREAKFILAGETGDVTSSGNMEVVQEARLDGDVTMATNLDRVMFEWDNNTQTWIETPDPASVTINGTAVVSESVRVDGKFITTTWCADPPERPNTTNLTVHMLLGFSNNTNESYPMDPCNHTFDMAGNFRTTDLIVNVSRYQYDKYGHPLFRPEAWEIGNDTADISEFEYTRTAGGFRIKLSSDLNYAGRLGYSVDQRTLCNAVALDGDTPLADCEAIRSFGAACMYIADPAGDGSLPATCDVGVGVLAMSTGQTKVRGSLRVLGIDTPCFSNPCENDAVCHDLGYTDYYCDCMPLWTGKICDVPQEPCDELENDCASDARCAHTGPCTLTPDPGAWSPCPGLTETGAIAKRLWIHECVCPFGFDGTSMERGFPAFFPNPPHVCTLNPTFKYYLPQEAPGELQTMKVTVNPSSDDVFVKDALLIRQQSVFKSHARFGRLNVLKEYYNSSLNHAPIPSIDMMPAECITEWDIRTMQRQVICPGLGNVNDESLVSAGIFGFNQSYLAGEYYYPLFLKAQKLTHLASNLICDANIAFDGDTRVIGSLTCANYNHGNTTLHATATVQLGSYIDATGDVDVPKPSGSKTTVRGNLLADSGGYANSFVVSPSAGEVAVEGTLQTVQNSSLMHDVIVGRSANNNLTIAGELIFKNGVRVLAGVVVDADLLSTTSTTLVSDVDVAGFSNFDVMSGGSTGLHAKGNWLIKSNAITTFSVQTWAQDVKSGNFTIAEDLNCDGFISTGTLDASKLFIDVIAGTAPGVGTTIEKSLIENGGFKTIQVDALEEMYANSPTSGGIDVSRVLVKSGKVSLALSEVEMFTVIALEDMVEEGCTEIPGTDEEEDVTDTTCELTAADAVADPPVVGSCAVLTGSGSCDYVPASVASTPRDGTPEEMSVTLATLLNSGHMAVMDGSVTTMSFMQYYHDSRNRLEPMAQSAAINAGTETDWTEEAETQDAFLTIKTSSEGNLEERLRLRANGDLEFGTGLVECLAANGDTTIRGDVTVTSRAAKLLDIVSLEEETALTIASAMRSSLALNSRQREVAFVAEGHTLSIRGNENLEEILQVRLSKFIEVLLQLITNAYCLTQITDQVGGETFKMLGNAVFCKDDSAECLVKVMSKDESNIHVTSHEDNDVVLKLITGRNDQARLTLQDVGGSPSQMNIYLDGQASAATLKHNARSMLAVTDKEGNHLLDIFDKQQIMHGEIEGNVQFGGSDIADNITLTIFSDYEKALLEVTSGATRPALLSVVSGYGKSSVLSLINPGDEFSGGVKELRIKKTDVEDYRTIDIVDGDCWQETAINYEAAEAIRSIELLDDDAVIQVLLGANILPYIQLDLCEHTLLSIRPDVDAEDVSNLVVSGSGQFGSVDSSQNTYRAAVQSSDEVVDMQVVSAANQAILQITAGYLNNSILQLNEQSPNADQTAAPGSVYADMMLLNSVLRDVEMLEEVNGNETIFVEGDETLYQSLHVRNIDHDLLTIEVDVTDVATSGKMVLDGDAYFCDTTDTAACTVTVQSSQDASLSVVSKNLTSVVTVIGAEGEKSALNLMTTENSAMHFFNEKATSAMQLDRTTVAGLTMDPSSADFALLNRTHFLTLTNVNSMGELSLPGLATFGINVDGNTTRSCEVAVQSQLLATLSLTAEKDANAILQSDDLCMISLEISDPTIGGMAPYKIFTNDLLQLDPALRIESSMNRLMSVLPNSTGQALPQYFAHNTTYFQSDCVNFPDDCNMTVWEFRVNSTINTFNDSLITVGDVHVMTDVVIGDTINPREHRLRVQSQQEASVSVMSASAGANAVIKAGVDQSAIMIFQTHKIDVTRNTGVLTMAIASTFWMQTRSLEIGSAGVILPTWSITDEDSNDLFLLYDIHSEIYGSTGLAVLGGNVRVGEFDDAIDHGLTLQANRVAKLLMTAGADAMGRFEIQSGRDVNQYVLIEEAQFPNPAAPPHQRAELNFRVGLDPDAATNVVGSQFTFAVGDQIDSKPVFAIESGGNRVFRMYPKVATSNSSGEKYPSHQLEFSGSATFGTQFHTVDKNVTIQSKERATLQITTGESSDAIVEVTSGPGQSAVLEMRTIVPVVQVGRVFSFKTAENAAYGTGVFSVETSNTELLELRELSPAEGAVPGMTHMLTVTGVLTSMKALVVSSDVTLGDELTDRLDISSKFVSEDLKIVPNEDLGLYMGFTLRFANPTNLNGHVITFPDTSTRAAGGGNVLTRLSTVSTIEEVATLTQGSIVPGFGSIETDQTINTTCAVVATQSGCGEVIAAGNLTVATTILTKQQTYIGSQIITTYVDTVGTFTEVVDVANGNKMRIQSGINQKTSSLTGSFDVVSFASPAGERELIVPDIVRDLRCQCAGMCRGNGQDQPCGPGNALVLHRAEVQADEVGGAYIDSTSGIIKSHTTLMNPGITTFISMRNMMLTTQSIVVATIAEFGTGGIVVVHAVTVMSQTDGVAVITVRNIGQDSMVGHFKVQFVIF
jgi:hypothetical protein